MMWFGKKKKKPAEGAKTPPRKSVPKGLWTKCDGCGETVFNEVLQEHLHLCPKCGHHFRISSKQYIKILLDDGKLTLHDQNLAPTDPLSFVDSKPYPVRLKQYQEKTGSKDAIISGDGTINGLPVVFAILDFAFIGGSMGSVVGETITRAIKRAYNSKTPLIIVSASGGARMQESVLSLMQMAKTSAWLSKLDHAKVPYISILTNPTTAGVMASFASLGDIIIAEPGALLGFAGPRVIKQTIGEDLPEGFQSSEFFLDHGMIDMIVPRNELKSRLSTILAFFN
ncbi:MAG: acetyl-CoA carboxylase carboxyltransferase subunit beta [Gemmatimonadetes bacterium]|nr:MAG: acetyl-CoA carboxylase carboxyltransferase subunit beta [Gemmatimonadota bacterium]